MQLILLESIITLFTIPAADNIFSPLNSASASISLLRYGQEQLEFWRKLFLRVQTITEIDAANPAISVNLNPQRLDVISAVGSPREIRQIKLDLVPPFIESHRHCADERLYACGRLII
jgi:hypothetical protein